MVDKKIILGAVVLVIVIVAAVGGYYIYQSMSVPPTTQVTQIKVGVLLPLTGGAAHEGWLARHAIELAIDDINSNGGVKSLGGALLVPIFADTASKPDTGIAEAERLITLEKVDVLTGCYQSSVTFPVAGVAEKHGVPLMVADSISDKITEQGYKYVFRIHGKASWYGRDAVQTILDLNAKHGTSFTNIGLVYEDDEFGKSSADGFKSYLTQLAPSYKVTFEQSYPLSSADLTSLVTTLKAANPDIVMHVGYTTDAILFMRTLKTSGWYPKVYMGLGAAGQSIPDFVQGLGPDAEYVYTQTEWQPDLLKSAALQQYASVNENFKTRYGSDMSGIPADIYSSTWILYWGIQQAGTLDKTKIRDSLASINMQLPSKDVRIVIPYSRIDLTKDGQNPYTAICTAQINKGEFKIVWPVQYATIDGVWPTPGWQNRTST
jgi:branched-chain amino acid transport system substrate-binding protein